MTAESPFSNGLCERHNTHISYALAELSKFVKNQHIDLLRFLLTGDSLTIKRGLELVSRSHLSYNFLIKNLFCNIT